MTVSNTIKFSNCAESEKLTFQKQILSIVFDNHSVSHSVADIFSGQYLFP